MQVMQACMQLSQSFPGSQMAHKTLLPTWRNFSIQETPVIFHFQENMVTHFEFFMGSVTISVTFLPVLGIFQIMFDFDHLIFHLFE
jgi:hypothetical protein